jgi:hypothetical protein
MSALEGQHNDEEMEDLAVHAHNIRNNFFDSTKRLVDVIPNVILKSEPNMDPEIEPRELKSLSQAETSGTKAKPKTPPKGTPAEAEDKE